MEDEHFSLEESVQSLKRRIDDAKLRLDFASIHIKEVRRDHRSGTLPSSDPDARARAIHARRNARAEFRRVLRIYQDFIARNKALDGGARPTLNGAGGNHRDAITKSDEEP